jgi:hypothetical protein
MPQTFSQTINVNVDEMKEIVSVGIRRASAFLRFGLDDLEARDGGDFSLNAGVVYQFWPKDVSAEDRGNAREEFRSWLIGSCLRELNLYYGLFLDKLWWAIEASELHGTTVPPGFMFDDRIAANSNVAAKQKRVSEKLGTEDHFEELNSLSLARNALAHNAGVVRSRDCNRKAPDALEVKWLGFDMIACRGGEERIIAGLPLDTNDLPGEGEIQIATRFGQRMLPFAAGTKIGLSLSQIAELCFFYRIMADKTIEGLLSTYRSKGLIAPLPSNLTGESIESEQSR